MDVGAGADGSICRCRMLLPVWRRFARQGVFGTEGDGLAESTISRCDYTVRIPMEHGVDSLNVAASSAVAFWELRKSMKSENSA